MNKRAVWIDCDPGVDDAAALILAHWLPELEPVALSTVAGNVPLEKTTRNALALCELLGAPLPVYRGAAAPWRRPYHSGEHFHGENGLGGFVLPEPARAPQPEPMWDALYAAAAARPGELTLVTLGPMTNLATAFALYPALPGLLAEVVCMGGAATGGNRTPCAEYNIYADPEAAQAVFRSGVPLHMCGLDVTERAYLTEEELEHIARSGSKRARFLRESSRGILQMNLRAGHAGWCVHDACPLLYLAEPELFSGREAGVFVETRSELTLGKTVTDLYSDKKFDVKNAFVVLDLDRAAFVRRMADAFRAD